MNLKIIDYFDSVINEIDIEAEIQLTTCYQNEKKVENINCIRQKLIDEVNKVKERCYFLNNMKTNEETEIFADDADLFKEFCFFIESKCLAIQFSDLDFGVLVKTNNFYLASSDIENLKYYKALN